MKLFRRKVLTPEKLVNLYRSEATRALFEDASLFPRDYRIRLVVVSLVIMWAFAMAITISVYIGG